MEDREEARLTCEIDRINENGHALIEHFKNPIDLGPIPDIDGEISVSITDISPPPTAHLRVDSLDSPLTLTTTESSTTLLHNENDEPTATLLNFGETEFLLSEPVPVGCQVTISFDDTSEPLVQAEVGSIEQPEGGRERVCGGQSAGDSSAQREINSELDVENLVANIHESPSSTSSSAAGGEVREKHTCKCCGARVDAGQFKCDLCLEAGCNAHHKRCQFH